MADPERHNKRRDRWLLEDVEAMIADRDTLYREDRRELAHDIITVVRERILEEIGSLVRERTRK
jgi:hypothetical protein